MDPVSITLSITALLKLAKDVVLYIKDTKDAPEERRKLVKETSSLCGMLNTLVEFINDCDPKEPWFQAIQDLATRDGPLDQCSHALQELKTLLQPGTGLRKLGQVFVWKHAKEDITSLLSQIERLEYLVELALDLDHFRLSRAVKKELESIHANFTRLETESSNIRNDTTATLDDVSARRTAALLDRICNADYFQQHRDFIARHHQGTGDWFLADIEFQTWFTSSSATLFCPGVPGAGKTMMAALVIEKLLRSTERSERPVVFVYCNYKRQDEQTPMHVASTFLRQMLSGLSSIPQPVHDLYDHTPSMDEVKRTVHDRVADLQGLTIVIDALDECIGRTRSDLMSLVEGLQAVTEVRCMITSRDFHAGVSIRLLESQPHLEVKAAREDLERYTRSRLKYLRVKTQPDLQESLVHVVVMAADGMFLLAQLLMDSFQDRMNIRKIKQDLQNLPTGLDAYDTTYSDAMERIAGQAEDPKMYAEKVLRFLLCAKRPLNILEVQHSLMIQSGDKELDKDGALAIEEISSVCAGLVTIDTESETVTFVHYTTQEYLQRNQNRWLPRAEHEIAQTCTAYLMLKEFHTGPCSTSLELQSRLETYSLASYAATRLGTHLDSILAEDCADECVNLYAETISWLRASETIRSVEQIAHVTWKRPAPLAFTGVHFAARFGFVHLLKLCIAHDLTLEVKDKAGMTPLAYAAFNGTLSFADCCSNLAK